MTQLKSASETIPQTIDLTHSNYIDINKFTEKSIAQTALDWARQAHIIYFNNEKLTNIMHLNNIDEFDLTNPAQCQKTFLNVIEYLLQYIDMSSIHHPENKTFIKNSFLEFLTSYAHQDGLFHSLFTAECFADYEQLRFPSSQALNTARMDFFCDGNMILVTEDMQINTYMKCKPDGVEWESFKKSEGSYLENHTEYSINMNTSGKCELKLEKAMVNSYDPNVRDIVFKKHFLMQYADNYITHGEKIEDIQATLKLFPEISPRQASNLSKLFLSKTNNHHTILKHLNTLCPDYATNKINNWQPARQSENEFLRTIHVLLASNKKDKVKEIISPYVRNKNTLAKIINDDVELKKIYSAISSKNIPRHDDSIIPPKKPH